MNRQHMPEGQKTSELPKKKEKGQTLLARAREGKPAKPKKPKKTDQKPEGVESGSTPEFARRQGKPLLTA